MLKLFKLMLWLMDKYSTYQINKLRNDLKELDKTHIVIVEKLAALNKQ